MDLLANEVDDIASLQKRLELAMLEFPGLKFAVSFQVVGICWTFFYSLLCRLWSSLPLDIDDGHLEVRPSRLGIARVSLRLGNARNSCGKGSDKTLFSFAR